MLNVGQGDAFLVRSEGATMVIDGGPDDRVLVRELAEHRVGRIDLLVMTHPHADHIDGLARIAESFPLARALDPAIAAGIPTYTAYERALARRRVPRDRAVAGMRYPLGASVVEVLWPPAERVEGTAEDVNNNSIVLRVRYGSASVLFAGETQEEAQEALMKEPGALRADVLKVSHHGSRRMLPAFYAASRARIALIPVGPNTFGHPAVETLVALAGMQILRSDRNGEVTVILDGRGHAGARTERRG
jgi:competence protein ComEC